MLSKSVLNNALDDAIATFKSDAGQAIIYCPEDSVLALGETHKAMVKALEAFKEIIVHYYE
ncbi:MAG TPA: hypothetical protein GXX75_04675 [Clostridiales bacterium]|nr:hypothetical protein [Clostridiales bacterium]